MICVKDPEAECSLELGNYADAVSTTVDAVAVLAENLEHCWTGNHDCDECDEYTITQGYRLVNKLYEAGFVIVRVKKEGK